MALQRWFERAARQSASNGGGVIAGAPKAWSLTVLRDEWRQAAEHMAAHGGRLVSLWATRDDKGDDVVRAAYIANPGVLVLSLPLTDVDYPGIEQWFAAANRMQRAVADLSGLRTTDSDTRAVVTPRRLAGRLSSVDPGQYTAVAPGTGDRPLLIRTGGRRRCT